MAKMVGSLRIRRTFIDRALEWAVSRRARRLPPVFVNMRDGLYEVRYAGRVIGMGELAGHETFGGTFTVSAADPPADAAIYGVLTNRLPPAKFTVVWALTGIAEVDVPPRTMRPAGTPDDPRAGLPVSRGA